MRQTIEPQAHKKLVKHIRIIGGQALGIAKMLQQTRPVSDILAQLLAIEGGIKRYIYQQFDDTVRKHIALRINTLLQNKNLSHTNTVYLEKVKHQFPHLTLRQIPKILFHLSKIESNTPR